MQDNMIKEMTEIYKALEPLPLRKTQKFKILSIDGGGSKALYSMYLLNEFEKKYCIPNGYLISDYFHLVCGTSAGSMIATAISLKIPMTKLINEFEQNIQKIFPSTSKSPIWNVFNKIVTTVNQLRGDKYGTEELKDVLERLFQNKTMKNVYNRLCIPSYCINKSENCVFKNTYSEYEDPMTESLCTVPNTDIKLVDMVLASAAAPTYFQPHKINNDYYIDGGVWANNPSMIGIVESLKNYVGSGKKYDNYSLLSVGNLSGKFNYNISNSSSYFNVVHIPDLISMMLDASANSAEYFLNKMEGVHKDKMSSFGSHVRIEHVEDTNYSLDDSDPSFLNKLKEWAKEDAEKNYNKMALFFCNVKETLKK
jgi:patatin-like phospholipase/acyl hydrolase